MYGQPSGLDSLQRLRENVSIQSQRVAMGAACERQAGFPIPGITKEIEALTDMLLALVKLEFELGILEYKGKSQP